MPPRFFILAFLLWGSVTHAQSEDMPDPSADPGSSFYSRDFRSPLFKSSPLLPREVLLGMFAGRGVGVAQLRITWEWSLYHAGRDTLFMLGEGGGGYGLILPHVTDEAAGKPALDLMYEHVVMGGFGYRLDTRGGLHVGVAVSSGLLFEGARTAGFLENYVVGCLEGRGEVGFRLGGAVYGIWAGDNEPFFFPPGGFSLEYWGGFMGGLFVNWH